MENFMPVTKSILEQFERTMTAKVHAHDMRWDPNHWPRHFYIVGRELPFNFFCDVKRNDALLAKVYRDSLGYEVIIDNY